MLLPNTNVWDMRVQSVDVLLTASNSLDQIRDEVYYLATVCQVSLDPPLVSISPNPEYPVCAAIEASGYFGLNFLAATQGDVIARCIALGRQSADKLAAMRLPHERTEHGVPLLTDCLQTLECKVEQVWDSGDHRTFIGRVIERRGRPDSNRLAPHRFGGARSALSQSIKRITCGAGLDNLVWLLRNFGRHVDDVEEGTRRYLLPPVTPTRMANTRQSMEPPGLCLVGCGWWGQVHALAMKQLGSGLRRFFASRDQARADDFARRFNGEAAFPSLEAALADPRVDAVLLALPHHLHASAARAALNAGKHVLVEKPLALSVSEGKALIELAESQRLVLAVAEQYRLSPLVLKAKDLIDSGQLGEVSLVHVQAGGVYRPGQDWKNSYDTMGGGVLLDLGIHYVDVLRAWFGEPESVSAVTPPQINTAMQGEDGIVALLRFAGGPVASLSLSWSAFRPPETANIEILGEQGSLRLSFSRPFLIHNTPLSPDHWSSWLRRKLPWRILKRVERYLPNVHTRYVRVPSADLLGNDALIRDFVHAITTGRVPHASGSEGLRDLEVVLAAYGPSEADRASD